MSEKYKATTGLLLVLALLGIADAALVEGLPKTTTEPPEVSMENGIDPQPSTDQETPTTPPGGVRKADGPDVATVLVSNNFTFKETKEKFLLENIVPKGPNELTTHVLLQNGDRAGAMAWETSPDVKKHYLILKEALHTAFTPDVTDLLDETQRREGYPVRNLLTFYDSGLLPERVVFIRVRERLYEFHVSDGSSEAIFNLIEDLTN